MPWSITKEHEECDGWAVVKDDDGEVEGCHGSRREAVEQLTALNAAEIEAEEDARSVKGSRLAGFLNRRIKKMVEESGMTRAEIVQSIADKAGKTRDTVNQYLTGRIAVPPESAMVAFAEVLATDLDQLQQFSQFEAGTLSAPLQAVKFIGETDDAWRVGGYGVVFGGRDLVGEYFTKDTDFWFDRITETPMVLYEHGMDNAVKQVSLGHVEKKNTDDVGLWIEAQISKHNDYSEAIHDLVNRNVLGWSSGAVRHLIERHDDGHLKSWPIVEFSLTPTPAEPRTLGVRELRTLAEVEPMLKAVVPEEPVTKTGSDTATVTATLQAGQSAHISISTDDSINEVKIMSDETQVVAEVVEDATPAVEPETTKADNGKIDALVKRVDDLTGNAEATKSNIDALSEMINNLTTYIQDSPAIRRSGYYTVDGGEADKEVKSFGDYLLAVMRNDTKRLGSIYKSMKDMSGVDGTGGGYLVPTEFVDMLLAVTESAGIVRSRAYTYPAQSDRGQIPALDHYTAPTAGQGDTSFAGGVVMTWSSEGATDGETQPTFALVDYNVNKLKAFTEVPNELVLDSAQSVESLLTRLFGVAIAGMEDFAFLRGDGVGKPVGILNADAALAVAPDTNNSFAFADAAEMLSRFHPVGGSPVWLMHRSTIPDLAAFEVSAGSGGVWIANLAQDIPQTLFGYPILYCEHLPQANNSGHVILADLSAYAIFDRVGASTAIAYSEHASFTADKGTWRVVKRLDGQPWVKNTITLADPQGSYTVSPFVYFND